MSQVSTEPLVFIRSGELSDYLGRTDVVVFVLSKTCLDAPQFGLSVAPETFDESGIEAASARLIKQLLAHMVALEELAESHPDFIQQQESLQLRVFREVFSPWLLRQLAHHPNYFEVPPVRTPRTPDKPHLVGG